MIDCHLKIDGVDGEAEHKNHKKEIELMNWSWSIHNPTCTVGGGSSVGKGTASAISCSKNLDSSSNKLAKACADGKHFDKAVITMAKSGEGQQTFLTYTLKEVRVADYNVSASKGGEVIESFSLSYADIEMTYKPQKGAGSMGGDLKFGWDTRSTETR